MVSHPLIIIWSTAPPQQSCSYGLHLSILSFLREAQWPSMAGRCPQHKPKWVRGCYLWTQSLLYDLYSEHRVVSKHKVFWSITWISFLGTFWQDSARTWLTVFYNPFILKQYHSGRTLRPPWHSSEESGREIRVHENLKLVAASLLKPANLCTSKSSPNTMT